MVFAGDLLYFLMISVLFMESMGAGTGKKEKEPALSGCFVIWQAVFVFYEVLQTVWMVFRFAGAMYLGIGLRILLTVLLLVWIFRIGRAENRICGQETETEKNA